MNTRYTYQGPPIKIESHVPIPTDLRRSRASKYPFRTMKHGDSFAVPDQHKDVYRTILQSAGRYNRMGLDHTFVVRRREVGGTKEVRAWCVKKTPKTEAQ